MSALKPTAATRTRRRGRGWIKPDLKSLLLDSLNETRTQLGAWVLQHQSDTLHLARVAWRRQKCLLKFYQPLLPKPPLHGRAALQTVWRLTGQLRNLDVALESTLPRWQLSHPESVGSAWVTLLRGLRQERLRLRHALTLALQTPAVHAAFQHQQRWTQQMDAVPQQRPDKLFKPWALHRLERLRRKIRAHRRPIQPERQHQGRLLLKQERYALESLLDQGQSKKLEKRWQRCRQQQSAQGQAQDLQMALNLIAEFGRSPALTRAWSVAM